MEVAELTIDQIKEALEKKPEFKPLLIDTLKPDVRKGLEDEGLIIRTKEDDDQYVQNHTNAVVETEVGKRLKPRVDAEFGETMNKIDARILEITGIKKNNGEKSTDYYARALSESKDGDPITKQENAELKTMIHQIKEESQTKLADLSRQYERKEIESQVDQALASKQFTIPAHIKTEQEKQNYIESQRRLLRNDYLASVTYQKDKDGNIIFVDGGKMQISNKDGKYKSAQEIIDEKYGYYFLPSGRQVTGTGTGTDDKGKVVPSTDFKSVDDIHKYLAATGVDAGSKAYMEKLKSFAKEANIEI